MESALPSKSQPGLDEVDNYAICVEAGAKGEKRKPQSKYTDKDGYKIAKNGKYRGHSQASSCFLGKYSAIWEKVFEKVQITCEDTEKHKSTTC